MEAAELTWQSIAARLTASRGFWLSTVCPDGAPHGAPVWGAVLSGVWYCYTERSTVKARNLDADPRAVVHLDDAEHVLIVHGVLHDVGHPRAHSDVLDAFAAKYVRLSDLPFLPTADPAFDVLYALRPSHALCWDLDEYEHSQQRWEHEESAS